MRKVTEQASTALINDQNGNFGNTRVSYGRMYLFDNCIARKEGDVLYVNFCGWNTSTTKERLNGLCYVWNKTCPFYAGNDYITNGWIKIGKKA